MSFGGLTRGTWAAMPFRTKDKKTKREQELLHWSVWGRLPAMMGSGGDHANRFMTALWKKGNKHRAFPFPPLKINSEPRVPCSYREGFPPVSSYHIGHLTYLPLKNYGAPHVPWAQSVEFGDSFLLLWYCEKKKKELKLGCALPLPKLLHSAMETHPYKVLRSSSVLLWTSQGEEALTFSRPSAAPGHCAMTCLVPPDYSGSTWMACAHLKK